MSGHVVEKGENVKDGEKALKAARKRWQIALKGQSE